MKLPWGRRRGVVSGDDARVGEPSPDVEESAREPDDPVVAQIQARLEAELTAFVEGGTSMETGDVTIPGIYRDGDTLIAWDEDPAGNAVVVTRPA